MTDPVRKADILGSVVIVPSTGRVIALTKTFAGTETKTMEEDGVDYIVPTGKKAWIMGWKVISSTGAGNLSTVKKHTVVDTDAGTQIDSIINYAANTESKQERGMGTSIEAAKYINVVANNITGTVICYVLEIDV